MVKMSFTNNQTAFGYALYMIASSYFKSATCKNRILEKNMLLQYKEQKMEQQYRMEDICIRYMDKLVKSLQINEDKQNVTVMLKRDKRGVIVVILKGEGFALALKGEYAGKRSNIMCKFKSCKITDNKEKAA